MQDRRFSLVDHISKLVKPR